MKGDVYDPKALIREAYNIDGISAGECRSIFLDWALSLPEQTDIKSWLQVLLDRYQPANPDHPMTQTLTEGLERAEAPRRRGGWRSRPRGTLQ